MNNRETLYHGMTWAAIWIVHKEMVKRAVTEIRTQIGLFTVFNKESDYKDDDLVTTADYEAQKVYADMIAQCTPNAGVVAEENGLLIEPQEWESMIYTADPVDGTKALVRMQSDGIGSLLSVVDRIKKEIIGSYVADVMTWEMYYYRPGSDKVHRINIDNPTQHSLLEYKARDKKRILTLDDIRKFPQWAEVVTRPAQYRHSHAVSNGSIGTNMAKLWKWEVDAVLLKSGTEQPWDRVPCAGISNKLWYVDVQIHDNRHVDVVEMNDSRALHALKVPYQLIVHREELADVLSALDEVCVRNKMAL